MIMLLKPLYKRIRMLFTFVFIRQEAEFDVNSETRFARVWRVWNSLHLIQVCRYYELVFPMSPRRKRKVDRRVIYYAELQYLCSCQLFASIYLRFAAPLAIGNKQIRNSFTSDSESDQAKNKIMSRLLSFLLIWLMALTASAKTISKGQQRVTLWNIIINLLLTTKTSLAPHRKV